MRLHNFSKVDRILNRLTPEIGKVPLLLNWLWPKNLSRDFQNLVSDRKEDWLSNETKHKSTRVFYESVEFFKVGSARFPSSDACDRKGPPASKFTAPQRLVWWFSNFYCSIVEKTGYRTRPSTTLPDYSTSRQNFSKLTDIFTENRLWPESAGIDRTVCSRSEGRRIIALSAQLDNWRIRDFPRPGPNSSAVISGRSKWQKVARSRSTLHFNGRSWIINEQPTPIDWGGTLLGSRKMSTRWPKHLSSMKNASCKQSKSFDENSAARWLSIDFRLIPFPAVKKLKCVQC